MNSTVRKSPKQVVPLSFTVIPFGQYQGMTFDEVSLGYLDWLAGQPWLYGDFEKRLYLYLKRPCIQRELEALFPDRDLESNDFTVQGQLQDKWHGQPMPKADDADAPPRKMYKTEAWDKFADFALLLDEEPDPETLIQLGFQSIREFFPLIPPDKQALIRQKYAAWREQARKKPFIHPLTQLQADLVREAIEEDPALIDTAIKLVDPSILRAMQ